MTRHKIINANSANLAQVSDNSINLIVTSPPYPMIEMWDDMFKEQNPEISDLLDGGNGREAFEKMHSILNNVWDECDRVLANNGFICINIGDATRTLNGEFQLYSNHSKIIEYFTQLGYSVLPDILWRKQSNSPNKFMGSGMYPAGAYVTYEHEYILIFRKGGKRTFKGDEKKLRQKSAYFWEERNVWFSDLWEVKGTSQIIKNNNSSRLRNASFPLEIPYRLVNMYSSEGDTVLDPFCGFGTTNLACVASKRNSIGVEIDSNIVQAAIDRMKIDTQLINSIIEARIQNHLSFIDSLSDDKKEKCYLNTPHEFLVKTKQETAIYIQKIHTIKQSDNNCIICTYK